MKKIWNFFTTLLIIFLVMIMLFNVVCYIKRQKTGDVCPTVFGFGMAVVISGSMEPDIMTDDLVIIQKKNDYNIGEDITWRGNTYPVTHRIIEKRTAEDGTVYYRTQGIANNKKDDEITEDRVVGEIVMVIPYIGTVQKFLQTPAGVVTLLLIVVVLLVFGELFRLIRKK